MAAAETWLRERGVVKIQLMVTSSNDTTKAFYGDIGYEVADVAVMSRWLGEPESSTGAR
jgi:ribosomal protein S18 acetylase RimI-like enzyme